LILAALGVVWVFSISEAQSLFGDSGNSATLYQDRKPMRANRVGDILTILISESTSASNTSNIETSKSNDIDIDSKKGTGPLKFIPGLGLISSASTDFTGEGSTSRQQQITARVSVTVVGTKPNGDLIVEGSRVIEINGEREVVHLSGAVNPLIIPANNTIESHRVADLQVTYKGKGVVSQGSRPGLIIRLFNWIF
jgi:flagellar L-ring protein precursor FlgH